MSQRNKSSNRDETIEIRRKYAMSWNKTMQAIWQEKITLLGIINTGRLLASVRGMDLMTANSDFSEMTFTNSFLEYGLYVERGTGKNTPKSNGGDLGHANNRKRRPWFSKKYWYSSMRMKEFMEESLGNEFNSIMMSTFKSK